MSGRGRVGDEDARRARRCHCGWRRRRLVEAGTASPPEAVCARGYWLMIHGTGRALPSVVSTGSVEAAMTTTNRVGRRSLRLERFQVTGLAGRATDCSASAKAAVQCEPLCLSAARACEKEGAQLAPRDCFVVQIK